MGPNVLSTDTLFRVLYELKNNGLSICLTHGTFDLFHVGHLDMLHKSSKVADVLVVGLESDQRVKEYKPSRPVIGENSRAYIVSQLGFVDYVFKKDIPFTSQEHVKLYQEFGIDYITISKNYHPDAKTRLIQDCKKVDASLVEMEVVNDHSTSGIIKRVVEEVKV